MASSVASSGAASEGQWSSSRSTWSVPRRCSDSSVLLRTSAGWAKSFHTLVATNTSSRSSPLSASARPICVSLPYAWAVSMCR
jgi:hypothetical protein